MLHIKKYSIPLQPTFKIIEQKCSIQVKINILWTFISSISVVFKTWFVLTFRKLVDMPTLLFQKWFGRLHIWIKSLFFFFAVELFVVSFLRQKNAK